MLCRYRYYISSLLNNDKSTNIFNDQYQDTAIQWWSDDKVHSGALAANEGGLGYWYKNPNDDNVTQVWYSALPEINTRIFAHSFAPAVEISGISLPYSIPSDGYLQFVCDWPTDAYVEVHVNNIIVINMKGNGLSSVEYHSVFVKKGMLVTLIRISQYSRVYFIPLY